MLATPYFQERYHSVPSTQDLARERCDELPLLVVASSQTHGRGRSGAAWVNADRALAASLALPAGDDGSRPLSLVAGVAAATVVPDTRLKWPNDLLSGQAKVGGILVERSSGVTVVGLGLNLFWRRTPEGSASLLGEDPGPSTHLELAGLWAAELLDMLAADGWPIGRYRGLCDTLGSAVTWEPDGRGVAVDVAEDGGLIVDTHNGTETIYSGAVTHVRFAE